MQWTHPALLLAVYWIASDFRRPSSNRSPRYFRHPCQRKAPLSRYCRLAAMAVMMMTVAVAVDVDRPSWLEYLLYLPLITNSTRSPQASSVQFSSVQCSMFNQTDVLSW